jgi:signal transduction histidine kinase/ligand-binding sensor domain-containing protein
VSANVEHCYGESSGIKTLTAGSIAADAQGQFWIGGIDGRGTLLKWAGKLIGEYPLLGTRGVLGIVVDADGAVWVGTRQGLLRFVAGKWQPYSTPAFNGANIKVSTLFLDREGYLWVGTVSQGLYRIQGDSVDHFGHEDGLSHDSVERIFQDREGGIWVATSEGVDHFRDLPIVTYSNLKGLAANDIASVLARRDGSIAVGTGSSFVSIRGSTITPLKAQSGLAGNGAGSTLEDHLGNLWICLIADGLVAEVNGRLRVVLMDRPSAFISLAEDADHAIWAVIAGPHARLIRIEDFQVREEFKPPQLPAGFAVIADPHGGVWFSAFDGSLRRYQKGTWQKVSMDPLVQKYGRIGSIYNMTIDADGTLWGAAGGGVVSYRNGTLQLLNARNGLPCSHVDSTISDLHNDLWIQAQCGLVRIEHTELQRWWTNPESRLKVSTFAAIDGFRAGMPLGRPAATRGIDGKLWFQNLGAVMAIDPSNLGGNTVLPPVHVEKVIADRNLYSSHNDLRLPARTHQLEIHYTALSFVVPAKVLFRYMLEGYDTQWQEPGTRRAAFYNDLRPGKYTFRVIACNNSGLWNTAGASLHFTVLPAYYQTNWFRALCGIAFLGLLFAIYQLRLRQLQRQFNIGLEASVKERTRIARELHDTLLQDLHGLMFQFQAARNLMTRRPDVAMQSLDEAIGDTKKALAESRDAIQGLRSELIQDGDLAGFLAATSRELANLDGTGDELPNFELIEEGDRKMLSAANGSEVCRIALEILRNAYRHAHAHRIEAEIRYGDQMLRLRIRDDGKGIDPEVLKEGGIPGHWGLRGVRERAERIGARVDFWSEAGAGTEFQLEVPANVAYETSPDGVRSRFFRKVRNRA